MAVMIAAAGALISGFFGSRSAKNQAKAEERKQKLSDQYAKYLSDIERQRFLEDRRRKEEGVAQYRQFYTGNRQFAPVAMSDPNSVRPVDPYAPRG